MKKLLFVPLAVCVFLSAATQGFCQDESEGFLKRTWRKFIKSDEKDGAATAGEAKQPAAAAPVRNTAAKAVIPQQEAVEGVVVREDAAGGAEGVEVTVMDDGADREEMLLSILDELDMWGDEIAGVIPGLVKSQKDGKLVYMYKKDSGEVVDVKDLDSDLLRSLYVRISRQAAVLDAERINEQLAIMNQVQELERLRRLPEAAPSVPQVPKAPGASGANVPKIPSPPSPPKPPATRTR
ncbi:MAG: hypothetical protein ABH885_07190 [Candidatus Omnitrophota bacterium]